jgi:hypothetical protein
LNPPAKFNIALPLLGGPAKKKWLSAIEEILETATPTEARHLFLSGATSNTAEDLREFLMNVKNPLT